MRAKLITIASRAALVALAISAAVPSAAETRPIHPYRVFTGQRVRLWTPPEHGGFTAVNAVVTAVDSEGLTVVFKDRTELVAFTDVSRMDVRRGWRYLHRAAVIGLVAGAVIGAVTEDGDDGDKFAAAALYGGVGAVVGAGTAAAIWPAKWMPVDIEAIRPHAGPKRGAMRLSFTLSF